MRIVARIQLLSRSASGILLALACGGALACSSSHPAMPSPPAPGASAEAPAVDDMDAAPPSPVDATDEGDAADAGPPPPFYAATCAETPPTVGDLPLAVGAAIRAKCQACHANPPKDHAPFPITTYEDTIRPFGMTGKLRWERMYDVTRPGSIPHMPFGNAAQLTMAEMDTLDGWFMQCAPPVPEGTGGDADGG